MTIAKETHTENSQINERDTEQQQTNLRCALRPACDLQPVGVLWRLALRGWCARACGCGCVRRLRAALRRRGDPRCEAPQ